MIMRSILVPVTSRGHGGRGHGLPRQRGNQKLSRHGLPVKEVTRGIIFVDDDRLPQFSSQSFTAHSPSVPIYRSLVPLVRSL